LLPPPKASKKAAKPRKAAEQASGERVEIALSNIEKARLVPEF
jgi:hypothetical protein